MHAKPQGFNPVGGGACDKARQGASGQPPEKTYNTHLYTRLWSVYLCAMDSRDIIRAIEKAGWVHVATKGSHWQFRHPTLPGRVTVPHPKRDLPIGTAKSIEKQAGVKLG